MISFSTFRTAFVVAMVLCIGAGSRAQPAAEARNFAVFSEAARVARVVVFQESIGTKLEANKVVPIPMPDGVLDKVALVSAGKALGEVAAGEKAWFVSPLEVDLFATLQNPIRGSTIRLPADLLQAMTRRGSTHLLLFTSHRDDAVFEHDNRRAGDGKLDGLGFYVDRQTPMRLQTATGFETATGFLGVYAYLRASLIQLPDGKLVATAVSTAHQTIPAAAGENSRNPWDALDNKKKIELLRSMLETEVTRLTKAVVAP